MKLIKLLRRLPIKWQHKLRWWGQMAEYYSHMLVITEEGTMALIEGCVDPDYAEYDRRVAAMQARWGIYDADLQRFATVRRLVEFKLRMSGARDLGESNL